MDGCVGYSIYVTYRDLLSRIFGAGKKIEWGIEMSVIVDAGGLSCPQPVFMTLNVIKEIQKGEITVNVDTNTSKENISRLARGQGWDVNDIQKDEAGYRITIKKE